MRIALLLSSLAFAACTVGEVDSTDNTGSGSGSGSGSNNPDACVDRLATPGPANVHTAPVVAGNASNAGQNCIQSKCHLNSDLGGTPGAMAPGFQFAGTVVKQGTTQPDAGAVVRIVSNGMVVATTYTDQAGNFYISAGTLSGAFTANTSVSACPTVTKMVTPLVGGTGGGGGANSCNSCHLTGASAQAPPIYLQ
jgi:hypothetical protein